MTPMDLTKYSRYELIELTNYWIQIRNPNAPSKMSSFTKGVMEGKTVSEMTGSVQRAEISDVMRSQNTEYWKQKGVVIDAEKSLALADTSGSWQRLSDSEKIGAADQLSSLPANAKILGITKEGISYSTPLSESEAKAAQDADVAKIMAQLPAGSKFLGLKVTPEGETFVEYASPQTSIKYTTTSPDGTKTENTMQLPSWEEQQKTMENYNKNYRQLFGGKELDVTDPRSYIEFLNISWEEKRLFQGYQSDRYELAIDKYNEQVTQINTNTQSEAKLNTQPYNPFSNPLGIRNPYDIRKVGDATTLKDTGLDKGGYLVSEAGSTLTQYSLKPTTTTTPQLGLVSQPLSDILAGKPSSVESGMRAIGMTPPSEIFSTIFGIESYLQTNVGPIISKAMDENPITKGNRLIDSYIPTNTKFGEDIASMEKNIALEATTRPFSTLFAIPVNLVMQGEQIVTNPSSLLDIKGMAESTYTGLIEKPLETIGTLYVGGKIIGGVYNRLPVKPAIETVKFTTTTGKTSRAVSFGVKTSAGPVENIRGLSLVKSPEGVSLSRISKAELPIDNIAVKGARTVTEAKIIENALGEEGKKISLFRDVRSVTSKSGVELSQATPIIEEVFTEAGISKPDLATSAMIKTMKNTRSTLYGSAVQEGAAGEVSPSLRIKIPGDFDLQTKSIDTFKTEIVKNVNKAVGNEELVLMNGDVVVKTSGKKLYDVHTPEEAPPYSIGGIGSRDKIIYGIREEGSVRTAEGIDVVKFSEQTTRKGSGAMFEVSPELRTMTANTGEFSTTGRILPEHAGRMKDIVGEYAAERVNIEKMKLSGKDMVETALKEEQWLDLWGKEAADFARSKYAENIKTGIKTEVLSYEGIPENSGISSYGVIPSPYKNINQNIETNVIDNQEKIPIGRTNIWNVNPEFRETATRMLKSDIQHQMNMREIATGEKRIYDLDEVIDIKAWNPERFPEFDSDNFYLKDTDFFSVKENKIKTNLDSDLSAKFKVDIEATPYEGKISSKSPMTPSYYKSITYSNKGISSKINTTESSSGFISSKYPMGSSYKSINYSNGISSKINISESSIGSILMKHSSYSNIQYSKSSAGVISSSKSVASSKSSLVSVSSPDVSSIVKSSTKDSSYGSRSAVSRISNSSLGSSRIKTSSSVGSYDSSISSKLKSISGSSYVTSSTIKSPSSVIYSFNPDEKKQRGRKIRLSIIKHKEIIHPIMSPNFVMTGVTDKLTRPKKRKYDVSVSGFNAGTYTEKQVKDIVKKFKKVTK